jgi:hypothetical protein
MTCFLITLGSLAALLFVVLIAIRLVLNRVDRDMEGY